MTGGQCRFTGSPLTDSLALLPHVAGMTKKKSWISADRHDTRSVSSFPHKAGEALGDSFVSGNPVNGTMHELVVVICAIGVLAPHGHFLDGGGRA